MRANEMQPITSPILSSTPQQAPVRPPPQIMSGGYVKPDMLMRPAASGYVQHTAMPSAATRVGRLRKKLRSAQINVSPISEAIF